VSQELACLKHMLMKAVDWEMIETNPAKKVSLLTENNERARYVTKKEIEKLYECSADHLKPIILTALFTGMRKNEILKLKWEDIDFEQGIIFVRNSRNNEMREIPINDQPMLTLRSKKFKLPYVFVKEDRARYISTRTSFRNAAKRAKINDFRFHDLRHTFALHLVMSGVDLTTVKDRLGHKTINMTLRYTHLSPDHKRHAVNSLRFFDGYNLVTGATRIKEVEDASS